MRVVEALSKRSTWPCSIPRKNSWRIRGQESYAYEVAQWFDYDLAGKVIVVPIGDASNVTAVLEGLLRFHDLGIIERLPKVIGVQSRHANPVFKYCQEHNPGKRLFVPVTVQPSVAQAAMISQPVSMPPGDPAGRRIQPARRRCKFCRGGSDGAGDYGLHAAGQPQRPHRLHPGGRIPGRLAAPPCGPGW